MMFIKHYAPNRCLCIKVANSIDHWVEDCRDVTKAGGGGICTKNGSYCDEKEKKSVGGGGQGRCERRSEAFVKLKFFFFLGGGVGLGGGGQGGCELRSEAFVKIQKFKKKNFFFFFWGGGGRVGGGGGFRVDVNGEVKLL